MRHLGTDPSGWFDAEPTAVTAGTQEFDLKLEDQEWMQMLRKRIRMVVLAFCLELGIYALLLASPKNAPWSVLVIPVLLPGSIVQFFIGGGMSMIDGLSPEWRTDLAFASGFLINASILYGLCVVLSRFWKEIRPIFRIR